jgi:ribosomal protein L21E
MQRFEQGDPVRIDIPDKTDPDHGRYHGVHGTIVEVLEDNADAVTGDRREGLIYRVELEMGEQADFRWRDLRPPIDE